MTIQELEWLAKRANLATIIVEIGCYCGRSTRAICDNTKALTFAVDPWDGIYFNKDNQPIKILRPDAFDIFNRNLEPYIKSGQLEILRCKSEDFPNIGSNFADFIFLDGDHRYPEVVKDIQLAKRLCAKGGIISGHDYTHSDWPGVKQAVDEIYPEAKKVESIWWTIQR